MAQKARDPGPWNKTRPHNSLCLPSLSVSVYRESFSPWIPGPTVGTVCTKHPHQCPAYSIHPLLMHSFPTAETCSRTQGSASVFSGLAGLVGPSTMLAATVQASAWGTRLEKWECASWKHGAPARRMAGSHSGAPTKQTVRSLYTRQAAYRS